MAWHGVSYTTHYHAQANILNFHQYINDAIKPRKTCLHCLRYILLYTYMLTVKIEVIVLDCVLYAHQDENMGWLNCNQVAYCYIMRAAK